MGTDLYGFGLMTHSAEFPGVQGDRDGLVDSVLNRLKAAKLATPELLEPAQDRTAPDPTCEAKTTTLAARAAERLLDAAGPHCHD